MTKILRIIFYIYMIFIVFLSLADIIYPVNELKYVRSCSKLILDKDYNVINSMVSPDGYWRFRAEKDEIPELIKKSVCLFEDKYFYGHYGVNPFSMAKAVFHNLFNKRKIGGSTITMQLARMAGGRDRTYSSKIVEIFRAFQLERKYTKDELLTMYLNTAPYGGNIEGIKTAAYFYFGKNLKNLTVSEVAALTLVPKNPNSNRPDKSDDLNFKKNFVLKKMFESALIDEKTYKSAVLENLTSKRKSVPYLVPHLANREEIKYSESNEIVTAIDMELQKYVESVIFKAVRDNEDRNVHNSAAIVINNKTMLVEAYAGSNDFYDTEYGGQNDGVKMMRSPGSALKPFVYALALENGLITPKQRVFDISLSMGGYFPENFDKVYNGIVSAEDALQRSLNVPAIDLDRSLKENGLHNLLVRSKISSVNKDKNYYGQSISIGGVDISLENLARLFTAFSNNGVCRSVRLYKNQPVDAPVHIIDDGAAYIVSEILAGADRAEIGSFWQSASGVGKVAFKTGTSSKFRDFVTVGYNSGYTVAVWLGNFSGESAEPGSGLMIASTSVIDIFNYLTSKKESEWMQAPYKVYKKEICTDAYIKKGAGCMNIEEDYVIEGVVLPECRLPDVEKRAWLLQKGYVSSGADFKTDGCGEKSLKPVIADPADNIVYIFNPLVPISHRKQTIQCYTGLNDNKVYWFLNGKFLFEAESGEKKFITFEIGENVLSCVDTAGGRSFVNVSVEKR